MLPSNTFKTSRKYNERQELTQGTSTQHKDTIQHTPIPVYTIDPSIGTYLGGGKMDFPNGRCQSPYLNITLSGLKSQELSLFHKCPFGANLTRIFILSLLQISQFQQGM